MKFLYLAVFLYLVAVTAVNAAVGDKRLSSFNTLTGRALLSAGGLDQVYVLPGGNVGIGTPNPSQLLSVAGVIESTTGGFKFPDGSYQTMSATTGPGGGFGAVQFNNIGGFGGDESVFYWDNIAKRLGLGNNAPTTQLDVTGAVHTSDGGGNGGNVPHAYTKVVGTTAPTSATCFAQCITNALAVSGDCASTTVPTALIGSHTSTTSTADDTFNCDYLSAAGDCTATAKCFSY